MKKIEKKLALWVEKSLISEEQKNQILNYENQLLTVQKSNKALYTFIILGVSIISIGFISLIAANWQEIPGMVKIFIDFIILSSIAGYLYFKQDQLKTVFFEAWMTFFLFMILASIGLIAQVFHTGGESYQAILLWIILILPGVLISKKTYLAYIWTSAFFLTLILWVFSKHSFWQVFQKEETIITFFVFLPAFSFLITQIFEFLYFNYSLKKAGDFIKPFSIFTYISLIGMIVMSDILFSVGFHSHLPLESFVPYFIASLLGFVLVIIHKQENMKSKIFTFFLILIPTLYYIPFIITRDSSHFALTQNYSLGFSYSILMLFGLSFYFSIKNRFRLFNLAILFIGIRFLIIYFQVVGSLLFTGLGLIFSGLVIIALAYLWYKNRKKIENLFHRIIK